MPVIGIARPLCFFRFGAVELGVVKGVDGRFVIIAALLEFFCFGVNLWFSRCCSLRVAGLSAGVLPAGLGTSTGSPANRTDL